MVTKQELAEVTSWMREMGILHLETPELKLTLTADAPIPPSSEEEKDDAPDAQPSFRSVHEHPDTYGGLVPHLVRRPM